MCCWRFIWPSSWTLRRAAGRALPDLLAGSNRPIARAQFSRRAALEIPGFADLCVAGVLSGQAHGPCGARLDEEACRPDGDQTGRSAAGAVAGTDQGGGVCRVPAYRPEHVPLAGNDEIIFLEGPHS